MTVVLRKTAPLVCCTACGHRYPSAPSSGGCPRCRCTSWVSAWVADRRYAREM